MWRWFYHTSVVKDGLQSRGELIQLIASPKIILTLREEALLLLLDVMKHLSTYDLVELCAFCLWPLAKEWSVELRASRSGRPTLTVKGHKGTMPSSSPLLLFSVCNRECGHALHSCAHHRGELLHEGASGPVYGEEHTKRGLVVWEEWLNRAYAASVRLSKHLDPNAGKKKRARAPEVDRTGGSSLR